MIYLTIATYSNNFRTAKTNLQKKPYFQKKSYFEELPQNKNKQKKKRKKKIWQALKLLGLSLNKTKISKVCKQRRYNSI